MYRTGTWQSQGGTTYEFRQYPKMIWDGGKRTEIMQFKPTQMRNYPIQGESGFFVQGMCGVIARWFVSQDFFGGKAVIINQVHDAVYLDVHKDVLDTVCAGVKAILESLPQHFNRVHGYDLQVPFPAAVEFGPTMLHKNHWEPGVLGNPEVQARLEKQWADIGKYKEAA